MKSSLDGTNLKQTWKEFNNFTIYVTFDLRCARSWRYSKSLSRLILSISGITTKIEITWKYSFWTNYVTMWELWEYSLCAFHVKPERLLMLININYWFPFSGLFFQRENNLECSQDIVNDYLENKMFRKQDRCSLSLFILFNQPITS